MDDPEANAGEEAPSLGSWRATLEAVAGYLCIADQNRRIVAINRATPGRDPGRFIGRDFADFVDEGQRPLVIEAAGRVLAGGGDVELETQGAESGRWFRARIAGILERGQVTGFVAHVLDVDDAKYVETQRNLLRARAGAARRADADDRGGRAEDAQRHLELIADALPVLISYIDRERRYQYNNAAYARWFGTSQETMRGRTMEEFLGEEAYAPLRRYVDAVLSGQAVTFETTIPYRQAGVRRVVAHYVPDVTGDGEVAGFYVLIEDVTARRRAEEALRRQEDELRQLQKMEALGRLAGGVSHDFNNLLQTVTNCCSTLTLLLPENDTLLAETVAQLKHSAELGASLTRQLLMFSSNKPLDPERVDVSALICEMELMLKALVGAKVAVEIDARDKCLVMTDVGQMQQVIMNLAINARDAMPDGGALRIAVDRAELAAGETAVHPTLPRGRYAVVTVADTGTGMDAETMARAFEPFFSTKPASLGTGLGLSTVYGIVQGLGGLVDVETSPGEGTRFHLYLPLAETASAGAR